MTTLILIRHGHTDWADKKLAGWLPDVHLNDLGRKQAEELPERLAAIEIAAIYSSPLERTLETAQPLAKARSLRIHKVNDLGEVKFGDWQGQTLKVLSNKKEWKIVQAAPSAFQFPGGESFRETQSRAVGAIEKIVAAACQRHHRRFFARRCDQTDRGVLIPASRWTTSSAWPSARPRST